MGSCIGILRALCNLRSTRTAVIRAGQNINGLIFYDSTGVFVEIVNIRPCSVFRKVNKSSDNFCVRLAVSE